MLLLSALTTIAALALAGAAIVGVLQRFVTQGLDQRLDAQLALLATAVGPSGNIDRDRLVQVQSALATQTAWQWRITTTQDRVSSRDFPVLDPGPPLPPRPDVAREDMRARPSEGRDEIGRKVHARRLTLNSKGGPVELVAAAPWDVVRLPITAALMPLLTILALMGIILGTASVIQLRWGLRPLRQLKADVAAVRSGAQTSLSEAQASELQPLATELNELINSNAATLATARSSAANLAHALKTPVATLALELRDDPERAALVDRLYATIRHHLARARDGIIDPRAVTSVAEVLPDLVATITLLHDSQIAIILEEIAAEAKVAIVRSDLEELLGNLIDNAARYAKAEVIISTELKDAVVCISVTDDGPGISEEDRARAVAPGMRLDERADGDGFGLAITRELVDLNGGSLKLSEAASGGLIATIALPIASRGV
jgi:signal transduction histidine kinase